MIGGYRVGLTIIGCAIRSGSGGQVDDLTGQRGAALAEVGAWAASSGFGAPLDGLDLQRLLEVARVDGKRWQVGIEQEKRLGDLVGRDLA